MSLRQLIRKASHRVGLHFVHKFQSLLLASDIDRNAILEAIDSLPENYKSVFNMYVIDGYSHNEIAKTLTISVGTSKSSLFRARKAIQVFLLEKIKGKPVDEKKKRKIAVLLFLGFGHRLFANFYQSKFQDFEITSKKQFHFSSQKVSVPNEFLGLTKVVSVTKISLISFGAFGLFGLGYYFISSNKTAKIENHVTIEDKSKNNNAPLFNSFKTENSAVKPISEKEVSNKIIYQEQSNTYQKSNSKTNENTIVEQIKDSAKTETQNVIVIKKRVVKRDTIYVTK